MKRLRLLHEAPAYSRDTFRQPGAFVEHARDGVEGTEIDFPDRGAGACQPLHREPEIGRLHFIAEGLQRLCIRHADADRRCVEEYARREAA